MYFLKFVQVLSKHPVTKIYYTPNLQNSNY